MTKQDWVNIMKAAGITEEQMRRLHLEFERSDPNEHQRALEYLGIAQSEIERIREWSRKG